jgi:uncharacterized protein (DUF427 family)
MFHRLEETHSMPWAHRGQRRPAFAIDPGPGQESVWDYPRPPRLVADPRRVEVRIGEALLARSSHAIRVLETASPPTFYLPRADVRMELLRRATGHSYCEWKGQAIYFDAIDDRRVIERAAWSYENPTAPFSAIAGYLSFYPGRVTCTVDGERVRPQRGAFYGGWVTDEIVGPYKGEAGTGGW